MGVPVITSEEEAPKNNHGIQVLYHFDSCNFNLMTRFYTKSLGKLSFKQIDSEILFSVIKITWVYYFYFKFLFV